MLEGEWRLQAPGIDVSWGGVDPADPFRRNRGRVTLREAPDFTDTELLLEDTARPRQDGIRFGQDYRRGKTITFQLQIKGAGSTNVAASASCRAMLAALELAWRGDGVRLIPGAMASLTVRVAGAERRVYGRPRKYAPNLANIALGEATAVATFDTADDVWYGPEQQLTVQLARPASEGGVALPLALPTPLATSQTVAGGLSVGGTLPAYISAEVHGPITNPTVGLTSGWQLRLVDVVTSGSTVTLDAQPWQRTILDSAGASRAGKLDRTKSRLSDARMSPGAAEVSLKGTDLSGTAYMVLRWSPAYASMA